MKKKAILSAVLSSAMLLTALTGCGSSGGNPSGSSPAQGGASTGDQTYTLRLTTPTYPGEAVHEGVLKFEALAEEYSGGKLDIQVFDSAQLASDSAGAQQVLMGSLEMAVCSTGNFVTFAPVFNALELPYLTEEENLDKLYDALSEGELGEFFTQKINEAGFQPIMYNLFGYRIVLTNKNAPFTGIDSFNGMKLRTTDSQVEQRMVEALGGTAMPLAWGDTITAIEQNTVNGWMPSAAYAQSSGAYDIVDNGMDSEHNLTFHLLLMNKEYYDTLPEDIQQAITKAAREAEEYQWQFEMEQADEAMQFLLDEGLNIYVPTDEEKEAMRERCQPVYDEFLSDPDIAKAVELIEATQE